MTDALLEEYARAAVGYVTAADEDGRVRAYDIGRAAMSSGLGVLDVSRMHTLVVAEHPEAGAAVVRASEFLTQVLAPFEMALRGFGEANAALKELATTLEQRVADRTADLEATERLLREQRNVLRSVLDGMSDGVAVVDESGRFRFFNAAAVSLLGIDPVAPGTEVWSEAYGVFLPDEKTPMPAARIPLGRALSGEEVHDEEVFIRNTAVPGIHLSVSASPLRPQAGDASGAVLVFRDVTARRRAEDAARKAEERLARAQRLDAIGQLAGGVAHDFNNLLAVVSSYADLLLQDLSATDPRAEDLREIAKAVQSGASLTRQLVAFSRQQVLQPTALDLNEIVADVAKMLKRTLGEQIELATSLDAGLGPVVADRGQLEQVILNLAVNARDAMPKGGKLMFETYNVDFDEPEASGRNSLVPGPHIVLAVTDTGTGMDPATKARIFEPFFTTKEFGRGSGLGLATVYGIVQQSRGHISVYSELGEGTSFKIYLPRATGRAEAPAPEPLPSAPVHGTETILLVEDDERVRLVVTRVLRGSGYEVLVAKDGADARAIADAHPRDIHLLMTDVVMPGTQGPALATELLGARPGMRVLFTSGYSPAALAYQSALPTGAAVLEKPFTSEALRRKVRSLLGGEE